ncbi:SDR family oxidoreductase [Novosphingobium sp.]|uniref:SDR family NAD(P)-dependent oxidoreductase n=1 Tax=Novosphingobium sp. TaxID=1874826 RepID=UPI001EBC044F|nr:SDR family oxidoreductase [Novosphingobium sp.]MBK6799929.1 SDR family oxidoreductase [Novosphingobium sp.]MBK9011055.1 SDR family oxidoreductase [Novosphingobium sp.]
MTARAHIVVGGTSGLGHAAARILAGEGHRVALVGRDGARAASVAAALGAIGEGSDDGGLEMAVERAIQRLGGLDGIAVTAGPILARGEALDLTDADWAECFDTQLMTVVRALRVAVPALSEGGGGSIVTCAAYSIHAPKPALLHYAAMKAAVAVLTKGLAKAHGAAGIRANCIAPGAFATEALTGSEPVHSGTEAALWRKMRDSFGMKAALDRIGDPHEAGELIAFLLSDKAAYLTGALINIDGGTDF